MKQNMTSAQIYLHFHIGRGGRYYNAGYVTFKGRRDFQELLTYRGDDIYIIDREKDGRFCRPYLADLNGTNVYEGDDWKTTKVGKLNFDYDYDSDDVVTLDDCAKYYEKYMDALVRAYPTYIDEVDAYLEENGYVNTEEE